MALVLADRVKETSSVVGTGPVTLMGASTGYQSFGVIGNSNTTYYTIAGQTTSEWEVGIGTYTAAGTLLSRTTVLSNSAGTQPTALAFSAGTKDVFVTYPAGEAVTQDDPATLLSKTLSGAVLNDGYTEEVYAVVDAAGVALSPTNGSIQTWTLGASRTPTAGTWASGQSITMMINDGTAFTVTWTTLAVTWVGGTAPTLATTGFTVITLWKVGSTIYGALTGSVA